MILMATILGALCILSLWLYRLRVPYITTPEDLNRMNWDILRMTVSVMGFNIAMKDLAEAQGQLAIHLRASNLINPGKDPEHWRPLGDFSYSMTNWTSSTLPMMGDVVTINSMKLDGLTIKPKEAPRCSE